MPESQMERLLGLTNESYMGLLVGDDALTVRTAYELLSGDIKIEKCDCMCPTVEQERIERAEVLLSHLERATGFPIYQRGTDKPEDLSMPGNVLKLAVERVKGAIEERREEYNPPL
jgi:hypothetical protein